ncbi:LysR substrate-binding domain-containing protein [Paraglaciecola sp.]|uniref:LysR substrate-binding domain-containing protein n=1 Tax=Paraglaciecola sp. TaxID=1920173 RepID=UPI003EF3C133
MYHSPITLEALLVLDAIESRGSFAAAAEQLNKVPSALSYIVQKLEEQLSVTIFVRQGRRSVLTPAGRHLLDEGRKLIGAVSKISEQTQTIAHGWEPKIRIAYDSIIDAEYLYAPIKQFLAEHPNIEIDLSEEVMNGTWEVLKEDKVDLVLGAPAPAPLHQGFRTSSIGNISVVLVVAKKHELARFKQPINKLDINHYRTVVVHDSAKNDVPRSSNIIEQSRRFYVSSVEQKIRSIVRGIGVGYLPRQRIQPLLNSGDLVEVKVDEGELSVELFTAWKLANKGKGIQRLIEILEQTPLI